MSPRPTPAPDRGFSSTNADVKILFFHGLTYSVLGGSCLRRLARLRFGQIHFLTEVGSSSARLLGRYLLSRTPQLRGMAGSTSWI